MPFVGSPVLVLDGLHLGSLLLTGTPTSQVSAPCPGLLGVRVVRLCCCTAKAMELLLYLLEHPACPACKARPAALPRGQSLFVSLLSSCCIMPGVVTLGLVWFLKDIFSSYHCIVLKKPICF